MTRDKYSGLGYIRCSSGDQENTFETQFNWMVQKANEIGIKLDADYEKLNAALERGDIGSGGLRFDHAVTGGNMNRPGLNALIDDALANQSISHVFAIKRDRFARPDDPVDAMQLESKLLKAGITLVFSDRLSEPSESGCGALSHQILSLVDYHESGNFLRKHSERILLTQQQLAAQGLWTGGPPSYGFARALLKPDGTHEILERGHRVRARGCHVILVPHDWTKIAIWVRILDLADIGWGPKRIATLLTMEGIPSPGAGQRRRDHGVLHEVSGMWYPNTVTHLINNRKILGILDYGRTSGGRYKRHSADGVRDLNELDRRPDNAAKVITNDQDAVISAELPFESLYDQKKWDRIQEKRRSAKNNQRGIPKSRDLGRYPLSGRAIDLSDGCGHPLYGRQMGKRRILVCGRYTKSNGKECNHNSFDAEALLAFVLKTLRQILALNGGKEKIENVLRKIASENASTAEIELHNKVLNRLRTELVECNSQIEKARKRLATVPEDLIEDVSAALRAFKCQADSLGQRIADHEKSAPDHIRDPEQEVRAAMDLIERFDVVSTDPTARRELTPLLRQMGLWLGLEFKDGVKGKKRRIRILDRGVLTFSSGDLPVKPFGKDRVEDGDDGDDGDSPPSQVAESFIESDEKCDLLKPKIDCIDACNGVGKKSSGHKRCISLPKVNSGDWIRTSDLRAMNPPL
ncbi:MAG: hypothetical protein DHS20C16_26370 [Phycisphaerae bacterium]|nr:MAG: hypothetical protein DHS20C16_26370 [Phycisphaerae bacterium]